MEELAGWPDEVRKLAMERFRLLQPHLEQNQPLRSVARAAGIPRLVSAYRRDGLAGLVRKKRTDRGKRRTVSDKLKEGIEGLALQKPPLPIAALHRKVLQLARERGEKPSGYGTVFSIVRSLPADLVTLAHEGPKAYSDTFELVHEIARNSVESS